jgi:hypothetical protein
MGSGYSEVRARRLEGDAMKFTVYLTSLRGDVDGKGDVEVRIQHTKFFHFVNSTNVLCNNRRYNLDANQPNSHRISIECFKLSVFGQHHKSQESDERSKAITDEINS